MPPNPRRKLPYLGVRAFGPTPADPELTYSSIVYPTFLCQLSVVSCQLSVARCPLPVASDWWLVARETFLINGARHDPSRSIWVGVDSPIPSGKFNQRCIDLGNYYPRVEPGKAHEVLVKVGQHESQPVRLLLEDPLGAAWDKFAAEATRSAVHRPFDVARRLEA